MGWEHVVPQFIVRIIDPAKAHPTGRIPFPILGTGAQQRAFVHIDDSTDALARMLDHGKHLNVYHLGNPEKSISERSNFERSKERSLG